MKKSITILFAALLLHLPTANMAVSQQLDPYVGEQGESTHFEPYVGQQGKDVIWVPTAESLVEGMLDMAGVTPIDHVIDLGSGDGRIVIAAAKRGARAVGYEFNPDMVELSKSKAANEGVSDRASFVKADIFTSDFSRATVITMYLLPQLNLKLRPIVLDLKPGTRIVSHAFDMGDWGADQTLNQEGRTAYLWIVPAKVEGVWGWQTDSGSAELHLTQNYQRVSGSLEADGEVMEIRDGKIEGDRISFVTGEREYSGLINGTSMKGTVKKSGIEKPWSASLL